jgi:hypothetical protein
MIRADAVEPRRVGRSALVQSPDPARTQWRRLCAIAAVLLASACTSYSPPASINGMSVDDIVRKMGEPTARYRTATGERLEYARGPFGKHTYMIDVDPSGRVIRSTQVLTEENFNALPVGASLDEVLQTLGHPSERYAIPRQQAEVWSYRYEAIHCQWFQVLMGFDGRVKETGYGPDPACTAPGQ